MVEKLIRGKLYPLVDKPVKPAPSGHKWKARWTGEKRPPLKGEYYLSGSIIRAYRSGGTDYPYHIAEIVLVKTITTITEVVVSQTNTRRNDQ